MYLTFSDYILDVGISVQEGLYVKWEHCFKPCDQKERFPVTVLKTIVPL